MMAARPRAFAYVGNENGTRASCSTGIPAAIAVAASCPPTSTARSPANVATQNRMEFAVGDQLAESRLAAIDDRPR